MKHKPWHQAVQLRDDLKSGELSMAMFAADLYEVVMKRGTQPVYEDPQSFFSLTYPTHNLRKLVGDVVRRLAGKSDKVIRQLELTYGGGKTHTLITLYHLAHDPAKLPDLPAVKEFRIAINLDGPLPQARVAALAFDKLDVEKGMEVLSHDGKKRWLRQPWSVLAWQLAGAEGIKLLHADNKDEERESAPAENLLLELLRIPGKKGLGTLILIDEVLMYAREKVGMDREWLGRLENFFQYLTQAATKVDTCAIVASLLASKVDKMDDLGLKIQNRLGDILGRQREAPIEPVEKDDVAEVLRRRFFKPESIKDRAVLKPHALAALKGVQALDEATAKGGAAAEKRFTDSFPFHPDLTEVFYTKWVNLDLFQRTRGVLRTFAMALRDAAAWDTAPLITTSVFLNPPNKDGLCEATRELVAIADAQSADGRRQAWTGILSGELERAQEIQNETVGLKHREIEQAVLATFLHSQPTGREAKLRDLILLLAPTNPDRIELHKGLVQWAATSHWLDDKHSIVEGEVPKIWRLGSKPNLNQMHSEARTEVTGDPMLIEKRLLDTVRDLKKLTEGAGTLGVRVHNLPERPADIEDDGLFHYAVVGPDCACESGKPSPLARRFLEETTSEDKPRVYRNAVVLLAPSRDGLEVARGRAADVLAWERVAAALKDQLKDGVDPSRLQKLTSELDTAKKRTPDAVRQGWCMVVAISDKDDVHAWKLQTTDEPAFVSLKNDARSRIQDTAVSADALMPEGPYNLWHEGDTVRRVKDLAGAFAQLPHLPKMLNTRAIVDTLIEGCVKGNFVLRLVRPDKTARTWWRSRPDEEAQKDSSLEVVLPEAAELTDLDSGLLAKGILADLWPSTERLKVADVTNYFSGAKVIQIDKGSFQEPLTIPKVPEDVVYLAIERAVVEGSLWLVSGPASIFREPIPSGLLSAASELLPPPPPINAADLLDANLPDAWKDKDTNGLALVTALSAKAGVNLPWKHVEAAINSALNARFIESQSTTIWPTDFAGAVKAVFRIAKNTITEPASHGTKPKCIERRAKLDEVGLQDFVDDVLPAIMKLKAKSGMPVEFEVIVRVGNESEQPAHEAMDELYGLLSGKNGNFQ
ncbi:MAG: DUF499 domain-containing protein [Prosthecobacter sp.]|uniref:DUF499 domain-containing protein n=1 Tax=Prosthecobacter sp. TaxID=1965333 RepID=UPI0026140D1F|nr:DUF499 domain-containing protein [Prosthecobacter sp.]MCF7789456.1 DUF499 domain-containing protein [Prosthecobacter sp.]